MVILCHGLANSKNSSTNIHLEKILNKQKIATFRFDFFGHGESGGNFEGITITKAANNISEIINFFKNKSFSKIGLVGSSFGGTASIVSASKRDDLFVLVLRAPIPDYKEVELKRKTVKEIKEWKEKGFIFLKIKNKIKKLNYSFFEDFEKNNLYKIAKNIKIPTLIIHGEDDKIIPINQNKKISKIIKNCELKIIKKADHRFTNQREKVLKLISEFIIKYN